MMIDILKLMFTMTIAMAHFLLRQFLLEGAYFSDDGGDGLQGLVDMRNYFFGGAQDSRDAGKKSYIFVGGNSKETGQIAPSSSFWPVVLELCRWGR